MESPNFPPNLNNDLPAYRARPQIIVITTEWVWSVRVRIGTPICYICSALFNCVPDVISAFFRLQEIQWIIFHTHAHYKIPEYDPAEQGAQTVDPAQFEDSDFSWIKAQIFSDVKNVSTNKEEPFQAHDFKWLWSSSFVQS